MNKSQIEKVVSDVMHEEPDAQNIVRVSLFGSFLHGNQRDDSDVDLLFEMDKTMSLFQIGGIQYRLQQELGRKVDFVPKNSIIKQLKEIIIRDAVPIYERE